MANPRLEPCMDTFGCMYAVVGCMYAETVGCKVCGCWVQSMRMLGAYLRKLLGACMRLLGASLTAAESLPDSR